MKKKKKKEEEDEQGDKYDRTIHEATGKMIFQSEGIVKAGFTRTK